MNFLNNFIEKDPTANTSIIITLLTIFFIIVVKLKCFYFDFLKNNKNSLKNQYVGESH